MLSWMCRHWPFQLKNNIESGSVLCEVGDIFKLEGQMYLVSRVFTDESIEYVKVSLSTPGDNNLFCDDGASIEFSDDLLSICMGYELSGKLLKLEMKVVDKDKLAEVYSKALKATLQAKNICQGAVIELTEKFGELGAGSYVVVSQSCDALHYNINVEEYLELLKIEISNDPKKAKSGDRYGKSLRSLTCKMASDSNYGVVKSIVDRKLLIRSLINRVNYVDSISESEMTKFTSWLARRYDRTAFPDNFCNAFSPSAKIGTHKNAYLKFEKFCNKNSEDIIEIWASLDSWNECDSYVAGFAIIVKDNPNNVNLNDDLDELFNGMSSVTKNQTELQKVGINGVCRDVIEFDDLNVLSMREFSREEMERYHLYNFDFISHKKGCELPKRH